MRYFLKTSCLPALSTLSILSLSAPRASRAQTAPVPAAASPAAGRATLSGTTLDGTTAEALPFATVLLRRAGAADTSLVTSAQTTLAGAFALADVPAGDYRLRVLALGYGNLSQAVRVLPGQSALALGALRLRAATRQLAEVKVTGEKALVQQELGKTVINVEKDLASVGGMATDVLRNVPSVAVDASGAVSLRGSSNLTILLDGKPAGVSNGGGGGQSLDQIPASRISQIEIMTNPSAKYDAQGTGVINIITKKNQRPGVNGQASLTFGTADKYFANLSLNHKRQRANWRLSYDRQDQTYRETTTTSQAAQLPDGPAQTTQSGQGRERRQRHELSLGLDYELSKEQSLSLEMNPHLEREDSRNTQLLTTQAPGQPLATQTGEQRVAVRVPVGQSSVSYRRTWAAHAGRELTADAGAALVDATVPIRQTVNGGGLLGWQQDIRVKFNVLFGQVDYVHPLAGDKGKLEAGLKAERQSNVGTSELSSQQAGGEFRPDLQRSYTYDFAQLVAAGYGTYHRSWGPKQLWQAQAGLRAEDTRVAGAAGLLAGGAGGGADFRLDYFGLFPTLTIGRGLGQADSASGGERPRRLQFSYARRLNRPGFMQQLAVPLYSDPRTYRLGNPALRAEFSHNLELGYQWNQPSGLSLTATAFVRFTQGAIQRLRAVDTLATRLNPAAGLVVAETYQNFGSTTNLGLELTYAQPLTKWWRVQASGSVYRAELQTNALQANARAAWAADARLNQNFQPTPTLDVQLTGSVRSTVLTAQGRQLPQGGVDIALRQRLFGSRAALTLRVSDIFDTQVRQAVVDAPGLRATYFTKPETRVGWLGFTWFIGASKAKSGKIESAPSGGGGFGG